MVAGNTWYLYGDSYSPVNGVLYVWRTTNIAAGSWTALNTSSYTQPPAAKHPGIVPVTADELTNIIAYWNGGPTLEPTGTLGDVNEDGFIDIVDALLIAQYYVGLNPANFSTASADTNCDGYVDIVDALLVAQYYVGLINGFC